MSTTFALDYDRAAWRRARRRIRELAQRSQDMRPAWNVFLDWFAHGNRLQFGSRGAHWRTPWTELQPATVDEKRWLGYQTDILVRTSDLLRSVADRPLSKERMGPHDMEAGTLLDYAAYHHEGTSRTPRRPLWDARVIRSSGAATSAVRTWIVNGNPRVTSRIVT